MTYQRYWPIKAVASIFFIVAISLLYHLALSSTSAALDGAGTVEHRETIMLIATFVATGMVFVAAICISYMFEMYLTAVLVLAMAVWIATPIISNFFLDTSPLS